MNGELDGLLTLTRNGGTRVSLERAALIETVAELGSISAAARRLGISYRAAWDAVQAMNNLFDKPLIVAAAGGKAGGAAEVTGEGRATALAFRRVQSELEAAFAKLDATVAGDRARDLFWSLGMKTSARNALRGRIAAVTPGAVNTEVALSLGDGVEIVAILTRTSVEELALDVGAAAIALIQSNDIVLAAGADLRTSARNQISGRVADRQDGAVNSEIAVDIGGGKTLIATVTLTSARTMDLTPGSRITALIKAPHVILAVE